jgi:hypothetical protein
MTQTQKKTGLTLAGIVAAVILVAGTFPHLKPILDWLAPVLSWPSVQAVALGWLAAAFTLPVPWALPPRWAPIWTQSVAALIAYAVAAGTVLLLTWPPSRTNVVYAFALAGMGSITINGIIRGLYLHFRPQSKPGSLRS